MDRDVYSKLIAKIKDIAEKINAIGGDISGVDEKIGTLTNLTTTEKTNLVGAINEVDGDISSVDSKIGVLSNLTTTEKTNLVGAVNELKGTQDKFQFFEYDITGASDSDVIAEACGSILTALGSSGAFQVRAMRTSAHLIMGWGVIRNSVLYGQFQSYDADNHVYVCTYNSTDGITIARTI